MILAYAAVGCKVTLLERPLNSEEKQVEIGLAAGDVRSAVERTSAICTISAWGDRLIVTTGSHVYGVDRTGFFFEAIVPWDIGINLLAADTVLLASEFDAYLVDFAVPTPTPKQFWNSGSLIEDLKEVGGRVHVRTTEQEVTFNLNDLRNGGSST